MAVRGGFSAEIEVGIARLRSAVAALHRELDGRVDGGTVSARLAGSELFLIGPSDIPLAELAPEHLVLFTVGGETVEDTPGSDRPPARDVLAHAAVYRAMPGVGGIARIPAPSDSVDIGKIPVGPAVDSSGDALGAAIAETLTRRGAPTVLMPGHGVYSTGVDARSAVDDAVLLAHAEAGG